MKYLSKVALFAIFAVTLISCDSKKGSDEFKTLVDSVSYVMGLQTAEFIKEDAKDFNYTLYEMGIKEGLDVKIDSNRKFNQEEIRAIMTRFMEHQQNKVADGNKKKAEEFLKENKSKSGVKSTKSGLQYEVVTPGTGEQPAMTDTVLVHYTGKLLNGEKFDSSVDRGQPAKIPLKDVIPGWSEGISLMKKGSKIKLYIHPDLGYGKRGYGPIEPNSLLIFEIELLDVFKAK